MEPKEFHEGLKSPGKRRNKLFRAPFQPDKTDRRIRKKGLQTDAP